MLEALFAFLMFYFAPAEPSMDPSAFAAPSESVTAFSDGTPVPPRR
jgi:hypothetical protein